MTKKLIIVLIVVVIVALGAYFMFFQDSTDNSYSIEDELNKINEEETEEEVEDEASQPESNKTVIGRSAGGYDITAYKYGEGETKLLFVGGIHGGYSWNTALVAYELIDYLDKDPSIVPSNVEVTVIPVLNPDGLNKVVGTTEQFSLSAVPSSESVTIPGRFNANEVDLNRNFDCDWQADATWQDKDVSGGDSVFSEPESQALRDYVKDNTPDAAVIWYSAADGVFASNCHNGVMDETLELTNVYSEASGYPAYEEYNFYEVTGDAANWLASERIPAISVLLSNHQEVEWEKNKAGIDALLEYFSN